MYGIQTNALVVHCPGPLRTPPHPIADEWTRAQREFVNDRALAGAFDDDPQLTIVTYNTTHAPTLLESCSEYLGLSIVVLGQDLSDWKWEHKITLVRDYLLSGRRTEHLICLDGADTMILASPSTLLKRFQSTSADILFCSTGSDWPPSEQHRRFETSLYDDAPPAHRHLNANYIGRSSAILACLQEIAIAAEQGEAWCRGETGFDDQLAWREMHRRRYPRLQVDKACAVFARFDAHR